MLVFSSSHLIYMTKFSMVLSSILFRVQVSSDGEWAVGTRWAVPWENQVGCSPNTTGGQMCCHLSTKIVT